MKLSTITTAILSCAMLASPAEATVLKYDPLYDYSTNTPLNLFACSDGANGLITRYKVNTLQQLRAKLKSNVHVAAMASIAGWNSVRCGECYRVRNPKNNKTLKIVAVDRSTPAVVAGTLPFKTLSPSGSLDEGSLIVYLTALPASDCFK